MSSISYNLIVEVAEMWRHRYGLQFPCGFLQFCKVFISLQIE